MSRFWSPFVADLAPYVPGEQPKVDGLVKLNTNENPYGPSPLALAAIRAAADDGLRLYPDPAGRALAGALAAAHGLDAACVFLGNGSDEVLAHAFNAFFRGKGPVLFPDVTYSFYPTYCRLYGLPFRRVETDADFRIEPGALRGPAGGIVLANPNAPTGIALPLDAVAGIVAQNPDAVVLVDEAYVDFGGESAAALVPRFDNLLVVQTFSKSRSLAGLRVGFALGQPALVEGLTRVKDSFNSYPLGRLALAGGLAAWEDRAWFERTRALVTADRDRTAEALRGLGFTVIPSAANFVFARPGGGRSAAEVFAGLRARGVLVRHFAQGRTADWLRISIGTAEECTRIVEATGEFLRA